MKKLTYVAGIAALLISGSAFGDLSNAVLLTSVEIDGGEPGTTNPITTYLEFATTPVGKPTCGGTRPSFLQGSPEQMKAQTSLALAAFLAGKKVKVFWQGACSTIGTSQYAKISHITIL